MEGRTKGDGRPIHRILIPFPLGLLATSFFFDIAWLLFGRPQLSNVSWWMILAGVVTALVAAMFCVMDYRTIPAGTQAKRIGKLHAGGNLVVVGLFAASWILRRDDPSHPEIVAIILSGCAITLAVVTGWLGSRLIERSDDRLPQDRNSADSRAAAV